eukprot:TRINITY_DN4212_c0_g1_i1.p1 TRINITY_DN4212_c0_g1~~TRINITY_DN4212_c0_g1_i1.p1  ORF type:complete len:254 (-),score=43.85 TRINITY_DN4212_c0_g1_i1:122-883(-)
MTIEQLDKARQHIDYHMSKFGYSQPNVSFVEGFIENLNQIEDASVDVVISNCVVNLTPNKQKVFLECWRILKEGGELYFSDVYSDRRIPQHLQEDKILWGECISGAMYDQDFLRLMRKVGFMDPRALNNTPISLCNPDISQKVKNINFFSKTHRVFKLPSLEDKCEDYGQLATYLGGLEGCEDSFVLDDHHIFMVGLPVTVCGNTADMLSLTRYGKFFSVTPRGEHQGLFNCSEKMDCSGGICCTAVGDVGCC